MSEGEVFKVLKTGKTRRKFLTIKLLHRSIASEKIDDDDCG